MNSTKVNRGTHVAIAVVVFIAAALLVNWYVTDKQADFESSITQNILKQEATMVSLAGKIARDEADSVVNRIVEDCVIEDRARFDELLGNLSQLSTNELSEIKTLFDTCGSFYTDRRAIMTARLDREVTLYSDYVDLLQLTRSDTTKHEPKLADWQALIEIEKDRSQLMSELVKIQEEIIDLLVAGESIDSEVIRLSLGAAQTAKETVFILTTKTDELRAKLSSL